MPKTQIKNPKEARDRYQNLFEDEEDKRWKNIRDRYKNLPEKKKKKQCEYMKNIYHIKVTIRSF